MVQDFFLKSHSPKIKHYLLELVVIVYSSLTCTESRWFLWLNENPFFPMSHLTHIVNRAVHMGAEPAVPRILSSLATHYPPKRQRAPIGSLFSVFLNSLTWNENSLSELLFTVKSWASIDSFLGLHMKKCERTSLYNTICAWKSIAIHFGRGWGTGLGTTTVQHMANLNPYRCEVAYFSFNSSWGS
jgi:hypothetical protein